MIRETCARCGKSFEVRADLYVRAIAEVKERFQRDVAWFCSEECSEAAFAESEK